MFVEVTPEEVENCTKYDRYQDHSCSEISHVASQELSSKLNGKITNCCNQALARDYLLDSGKERGLCLAISSRTRRSSAGTARFSAISPRANAHQNLTSLLESRSPASSISWDFRRWQCASASAASPLTRGFSRLFLTAFSSARMVC